MSPPSVINVQEINRLFKRVIVLEQTSVTMSELADDIKDRLQEFDKIFASISSRSDMLDRLAQEMVAQINRLKVNNTSPSVCEKDCEAALEASRRADELLCILNADRDKELDIIASRLEKLEGDKQLYTRGDKMGNLVYVDKLDNLVNRLAEMSHQLESVFDQSDQLKVDFASFLEEVDKDK